MIQGHRNPFGKPLTEYTTAQLDFVLEMASIDDPERYTFVRNENTARGAGSKALARWTDVLLGKPLLYFMEKTGMAAASAGVAAWRNRRSAGGGLKPGFSRAGKPTDAHDPR